MRSPLSLLAAAAPFLLCPMTSVAAQAAELPLSTDVRIIPATHLSAIADSMPGAVSSRQLARFPGLSGMIARRDSAGVPERHERFTDVFFVERGAARLRYGGSTDDAHEISAGEWRGGTIRRGMEADLHAGDVVVIPAGIPHQMLLSAGQRIDYVALKVPKDSTP
jgi:mannose-6-phosphate isomerase-like protein (cupin superfamily)